MTAEPIRALARNKGRSALAILGVAVAVANVITVSALGSASVAASENELAQLGDNLVWIEAGSRNVNGVRTGTHGMTTLTAHDTDAIRNEVPLLSECSENVDGGFLVVYKDRNWRARWRGVAPSYQRIKRWELAAGSYFDDDQTEHAERVIVIGQTVRRELFGDDDPIGESVHIQNFSFTVIGLLGPKGQSATGQDQDDTVMMPWTTAVMRIVGKEQTWLDDILCSAASADAIAPATTQLSALLRDRHHIAPGLDDDFNIRHPEELLQARIKTSKTLRLLLLTLGAISMLVGGIGVMNVMLASVTQRVPEIGLRASVGATPLAIQLQFVAEATTLTAFGGAIGVAIAQLAALEFRDRLGWLLQSSVEQTAVALAVAVVTGVVFGLYPAWRASRVDPIQALRSEG